MQLARRDGQSIITYDALDAVGEAAPDLGADEVVGVEDGGDLRGGSVVWQAQLGLA